MLKVLSCLTGEHNPILVLIAGLVCFAGSFTTFRLYWRMRRAKDLRVRAAWVMLTGLVAGCSVWATHFIAMLSYSTGLKSGFQPLGTMGSLAVAGLFMALAFAIASASRGAAGKAAGGVVAGLGVAAMHYSGMAAYVTEGVLTWDLGLVAASVAIGAGLAVAALFAAREASTVSRQAAAGLVLTLAICGLHFTAMGAISVTPDPSVTVPEQLVSSGALTLTVALIVSAIILGGLGAVLIEGGANEAALERSRRLADAACEGIVITRGGLMVDANAAFCELAGAGLSLLSGAPLDERLSFDDPAAGPLQRREAALRSAHGRIPVEVFGRVLDAGGDGGEVLVLAIRDLRERRAAEAKIRYLADHDGLTGLANRAALHAWLEQAIGRVEASGESLAVICLDLDRFKETNDQHGHQAGDLILTEVARRLREAVPAPSFVARLGGDEFVVVQVGGEQPEAVAELSARLSQVIGEPIFHHGEALEVSACLGVSLHPDDGLTGGALVANADMALYRAKDDGPGASRFFKREMDEAIRERRQLARELRKAVTEEELELYFQPQARTADGEICGFEALARWNHPVRGPLSPAEFIPLAEDCGLIGELGEWVLRRACAVAAAWDRPLPIAVNLSPLQLQQVDLPVLVHQILIETGLSSHRLELEITEGALFTDHQRALDILRRLKGLGVRIAMDDFGTGYSSLSTLQSFPFDKLKIDKSFVENIHRQDRARAIVRAVLGLGRSLDIPVTAEGVETAEQLAFLRGEGCAQVQGYAIGRPAPMGALADWTAERAA